jgi:hypothetical protein
MTTEAAADDPRSSEFCGCANCESTAIALLVMDPSVSTPEALRWVLAAQFAGWPGLRCAR